MSAKERLIELNSRFAEKLTSKGVEVSGNETTTELIDKVDEIQAGGGDGFYDAFWDGCQNNGLRAKYDSTFSTAHPQNGSSGTSYYWTNETLKPKYDMKPTTAKEMFATTGYYPNHERKPTDYLHGDLVELLAGRILDFSQATNVWGVFKASNFTRLGVIDFGAVTYAHMEFFCNCIYLETIDLYTPPRKILVGNNSIFQTCKSLKNLTLGGNLLQDTDLKSSPLTLESAISVITHLENYAGTDNEFLYPVTFSETTWGYLDAEGETASPNGTSWRDYIAFLGWNT
jgi:hypothetical protein